MEPDEMRVVAEFAALAPSVHNTQPWRFVAKPFTLEVHLEPGRRLEYLDPFGRQQFLSCGGVTEFARLAIRYLGHECTVRLLPNPSHPTLVAILTVGQRLPTTPAERRFIDAVPRRYTDRGPYAADPVPPDVVQDVREAVADRGCWLRVIDRHDDRLVAITLLAAAEAAELAQVEYRAELAAWRRDDAAPDGIPERALPRTWADSVSDVPLRDFRGEATLDYDRDNPPAIERDTVLLLGTDHDSPRSWLQAGRALAVLQLTLTDAGLVCQPLGPVMDLPGTRERLRSDLGLVAYPQMMLRAGFGSGRIATGRRSVEDMFSIAATT